MKIHQLYLSLFVYYSMLSCSGSTQDADLVAGKYIDESSLQLSEQNMNLQSDSVDTSASGVLIIKNQGSANLIINSVNLEGNGYSLVPETTSCNAGIEIEPNKGCYIDIKLEVSELGLYPGKVLIGFENESGKRKYQKSVLLNGAIEAITSGTNETPSTNKYLDSFSAKFNKSGIGILDWKVLSSDIKSFKISHIQGKNEPETCDDGVKVSIENGKDAYTHFYSDLSKVGFYAFRLCALDDQGNTLESLTSIAQRNKPEYVTSLTAKLLSKSSVKLSWDSDHKPLLFRIVYNSTSIADADCSGAFQSIIVDNVSGTQKTITGLDILGNYSFRVCGVLNTGGYSKGKIVSISNRGPLPVLTSLNGSYSQVSSFPIKIDFGEDVSGFSKSKINVTGGSVASLTGSGSVYQATISASSDGDVVVTLPLGAAKGVNGESSSLASSTVTVDTQAPTASFATLDSATNSSSVNVTINFSETVQGFSQSDITASGGSISSFSFDNLQATFTISSMTEGTVSMSIASGSFTDLSGNVSTSAASTSFAYDVTAPQNPTISISSGAASVSSTKTTLGLSATGAQEVYVTNTSGCGSGGYWDTYSTVYAWTLGETNQVTNVYVKYRDAAGNETSCVSDSIIMDAQSPTAISSLSINIIDYQITYSFTAATDALSGVSDYKMAIGSSSGATDVLSYTSLGSTANSGTYTLSSLLTIGQTYYVSIRAIDAAENQSVSVEVTALYGFTQQAYLKASNAGNSDYFGAFEGAVDISGDTVVVGAYQEDNNQTTVTNGSSITESGTSNGSGAAYVFVRSASSWSQQAYLKASNAGGSDYFGYQVAVDGNTIAVGAYAEDSNQTTVTNGAAGSSDNSSTNAGAVYVFERSGTTWSEQAYLKAPNQDSNDNFGLALDISNNTIVVGAKMERSNQSTITNGTTGSSDNSLTWSGAAYVFERSGTTWSQQAYLKPPNMGSGDRFGYSVAISNNTIAVATPYENSGQTTITNGSTVTENGTASESGAAYVFYRSGTSWTLQSHLKASNADADPGAGYGDYFGVAVDISDDTIVVGAEYEASNQTTITNGTGASSDNSHTASWGAGAAYVFYRSGTSWSQQAYLKSSNLGAGDKFGTSLGISGNTIVVGAPKEDNNQSTITNGSAITESGTSTNAGAAYVFYRNASSWSQHSYLKAPIIGGSDDFGRDVDISGSTVVVSAPYEDSNQSTITNSATAANNDSLTNSGAVYIFTK